MDNIRIDDSEGDLSQHSEGEQGEHGEDSWVREDEEDGSPKMEIGTQENLDGEADTGTLIEQPSPLKEDKQDSQCEQDQLTPPPAIPASPPDSWDEVQSEYTYDQLAQQLQRALFKIKGQSGAKTQTFLDRVHYFQQKKHSQLQQRRHQQDQQHARLNAKPTANAHSQRILQHYQPIHQRSEKIQEEKRRKIERQQLEKKMREEEAIARELAMKREPNRSEARTQEEFLTSMNCWREQKERKVAALAQQERRAEMEGVTFHPQLNTHSKTMVQRTGKIPIQLREARPHRPQLHHECTFQPQLNKAKP